MPYHREYQGYRSKNTAERASRLSIKKHRISIWFRLIYHNAGNPKTKEDEKPTSRSYQSQTQWLHLPTSSQKTQSVPDTMIAATYLAPKDPECPRHNDCSWNDNIHNQLSSNNWIFCLSRRLFQHIVIYGFNSETAIDIFTYTMNTMYYVLSKYTMKTRYYVLCTYTMNTMYYVLCT